MALLDWTCLQLYGRLDAQAPRRLRIPLRLYCLACLLLLLALGAALARAQAPATLARQVRAAYLYKFAGFVEWPDGSFELPDSPLLIGVAGDPALADQLELSVAGHSVNGHAVQVKKIRRGEPLTGLHVLYMGGQDKALLQELLVASRGLALLTVSDSVEVHAMGSMINFVVTGQRMRFDVALKPVAQAHIPISARLLLAAYRVQTGGA